MTFSSAVAPDNNTYKMLNVRCLIRVSDLNKDILVSLVVGIALRSDIVSGSHVVKNAQSVNNMFTTAKIQLASSRVEQFPLDLFFAF